MSDHQEHYPGAAITVVIHPGRCIHSRNCVLGLPDVFVPNAVGPWIHPDNAPAEAIAAIALACPSGAIGYERHDGAPEETVPPVNLVRLRENGPLAVQADLRVAGDAAHLRATLCRCGASANKPYCDGSHQAAGFIATGEPETQNSAPLLQRDGLLDITPTPNGPLMLVGAAEIVSGTGRTITRTTRSFLCRCGASANKPLCDGSHAKIGFTAG